MDSANTSNTSSTDKSGDAQQSNTNNQSTVHLLPCSIDYDGAAPIKSFFLIDKKGDSGTVMSHFRGRGLQGKSLNLGEEVQGVCVCDKGNKNMIVEGTFDSLTIWEHDSAPDMAPMEDILSWFSIASSVSTK